MTASVLLAALCACSAKAEHVAKPAAAVATSRATVITLTPKETLAGLIAPFENVAIQSQLNEPTTVVNVNEGDIVHRGEVLAVLNTDDMQANYKADLASAQSNGAKVSQSVYQAGVSITQGVSGVGSAEAALLQAQQSLQRDSTDLWRYRQLLQSGYIAEQQVATQETLVNNDRQAVRSAAATLKSARATQQANGTMQDGLQASIVKGARADEQMTIAQAQQIKAQMDRGTIVSPVDGIVVNRNLNPGEYPGTRQIFTIQQYDPVYAIFNASGPQIVAIHNGTSVTIHPDVLPGKYFRATVVGVLDQVNPGSTSFVVKALLQNPGHQLKSGMVITGSVTLDTVHGIGIPATAFLDDSDSAVDTVAADGTIHMHAVQRLGGDAKTAVVAGLEPGTQVIDNGQLGLADGSKVAVR